MILKNKIMDIINICKRIIDSFSRILKLKMMKLKPKAGANKTGINFMIRGKLSVIR